MTLIDAELFQRIEVSSLLNIHLDISDRVNTVEEHNFLYLSKITVSADDQIKFDPCRGFLTEKKENIA